MHIDKTNSQERKQCACNVSTALQVLEGQGSLASPCPYLAALFCLCLRCPGQHELLGNEIGTRLLACFLLGPYLLLKRPVRLHGHTYRYWDREELLFGVREEVG